MSGADDAARALVLEVVADLGLPGCALEPLAAGLGTRRFYRVRTGGAPATLIARVEAPEDPAIRPAGGVPEPPLEPIRSALEAAGLPVPARLGGDTARGVELLEDVGDTSLEAAVREAPEAERRALYAEAVALVPRLQRLRAPSASLDAFRRRLDPELIAFKGEIFARESLPRARGRAADAAGRAVVAEAFGLIAEVVAMAPARLAHRDFQSRNLHLRPGAPPGARLVMIDLQGAFLAPPEYDLVCLLRDSYVELPEPEIAAHLAEVRAALPDRPDPESFAWRFELLTLARKGKDHARFLQAAARGERRFGRYLGTTVRQLRRAAARVAGCDPRLARFAELVDALPEGPACAE